MIDGPCSNEASAAEYSAEAEIRARIDRRGRISFAEFMEVALYHPHAGYYSRQDAGPEAHRDYYTSPAAHPAFGGLVGIQLCGMWQALGRPSRFHAVEMGAGSGLLARDVIQYAEYLPRAFRTALRYVALDRRPPSERASGQSSRYHRIISSGIPARGLVGCVLSNELVDSFPVHRFEVRGGRPKEVFLTLVDGRFVEQLDEPSTTRLRHRLEGLGPMLPEGYRGEVNLRIGPWMQEVADSLERGFALTVDYGHRASDLYSPDRAGGTLRTHYRHTSGACPYVRVGMQDITAHVDFSALVDAGEAAGLNAVALLAQSAFLRELGLDRWRQELRLKALPQRERDANSMGMLDLARPDRLGAFKVLVQEKDTGIDHPRQIWPRGSPWADDLPVPLLRRDHLPLMQGRYPHTVSDVDQLWPWRDDTDAPSGQ